jgi:HD superfamily phosphohydrolase
MIVFDRLYGKLSFPPIIKKLLDCPGLLRLREVHMSSVPFMSFPSFSSVNRYEHSLGVCHLANLSSKMLELSITDSIELMCASLYHDVATPPFAHVTEELLEEFFGFDHEEYLKNLLIGKTEDIGMEKSQIYLGKGLKLHKIIGGKEGREIDLDVFRIADMATGKGKLGPLVKGQVDLDNIDNVIRAATAMGIDISTGKDAEALSRSFFLPKDSDQIALHKDSLNKLQKWQQTRYVLYDMIYGAVEDFSLQTMLKLAIRLLLETESDNRILSLDWNITDEELVSKRIQQHEGARKIWERICLFKPFPCVGIFSLSGKGAQSYVANNLPEFEKIGKEVCDKKCVANFTFDKRQRSVTYPLVTFSGSKEIQEYDATKENAFLFFFTPRKIKHQKNAYLKLAKKLREDVHSDIDIRTTRRIDDKYSRIVEERLI